MKINHPHNETTYVIQIIALDWGFIASWCVAGTMEFQTVEPPAPRQIFLTQAEALEASQRHIEAASAPAQTQAEPGPISEMEEFVAAVNPPLIELPLIPSSFYSMELAPLVDRLPVAPRRKLGRMAKGRKRKLAVVFGDLAREGLRILMHREGNSSDAFVTEENILCAAILMIEMPS